MKLSHLSSAQLGRVLKLIQQRESIVAKLNAIDKTLSQFDGASFSGGSAPIARRRPGRPRKEDSAVSTTASAPKARRGRKRGPGRIKGAIITTLKSAGARGISVGEIADKLGVKPNNIFRWFYTTGRKVNGIKKVGPGRYALTS